MDKELEKKLNKALENETPTVRRYVKLLAERPENHAHYDITYYKMGEEGKLEGKCNAIQYSTRAKLLELTNNSDSGILLNTDLINVGGYERHDVLVFNPPEARKRKGSFEIRKKIKAKKNGVVKQIKKGKLFDTVIKEIGKNEKEYEIQYSYVSNDIPCWSDLGGYDWTKEEEKTLEKAEKLIEKHKKDLGYDKDYDIPIYRIIEINKKTIKIIK